MKHKISIFLLLFSTLAWSQMPKKSLDSLYNPIKRDSLNLAKLKNENTKPPKAVIFDYKIINAVNDTTYVDTTLSVRKEYKFNYLRQDNFDKIPFLNEGQTYNTLSYNFNNRYLIPLFAARARHFNYMQIEDINYYQVPTPLTELFYKTVFEQGHLLDAFFTVNTTKQFNFSIAYKGLRSLGKYQHSLTSTGNFRATSNYSTKNNKYSARAHIVMQDLLNQENGGITDTQLPLFESGDKEYTDRSLFSPAFEDAENILKGKRFHLDHSYNLRLPNDSIAKSKIQLNHIISLEDKFYQFQQSTANTNYFGNAFVSSNINDKVTLEQFNTSLALNYSNPSLGNFNVFSNYVNYNYGYNTITLLKETLIPNRLKGDFFSVGGAYNHKIDKFNIGGNAELNLDNTFKGDLIQAHITYQFSPNIRFTLKASKSSKAPNFNQLLHQSKYLNYNWNNSSVFKNINTSHFAFLTETNKFGKLFLDFTNIKNYTYFYKNIENNIKPIQSDITIPYFRIKYHKEIHYRKFALDNTILYQKVFKEQFALNTPTIIARHTLYYSNHFFKKALFLQTGVTLQYFTAYYMNAYNPLLAEFYAQNQVKIGNFPRLDFFINAKVRQTRIFLKAEHFNAAFTGRNYYSAPNYPFRDFVVRFGLVWNFFM